jgi:hypothetical protein
MIILSIGMSLFASIVSGQRPYEQEAPHRPRPSITLMQRHIFVFHSESSI